MVIMEKPRVTGNFVLENLRQLKTKDGQVFKHILTVSAWALPSLELTVSEDQVKHLPPAGTYATVVADVVSGWQGKVEFVLVTVKPITNK